MLPKNLTFGVIEQLFCGGDFDQVYYGPSLNNDIFFLLYEQLMFYILSPVPTYQLRHTVNYSIHKYYFILCVLYNEIILCIRYMANHLIT